MKRTPDDIRKQILDSIDRICERLDAILESMSRWTPVPVTLADVQALTRCNRHLGVEDGREIVCKLVAGHEGECRSR